MNRPEHNNAEFFVGTEIERSPAYNHKTLFVVGTHRHDIIQWQLDTINSKSKEPITHIYFGANMSFPNPNVNDAETWQLWESMIEPWLAAGYLCTLDVDVRCIEGLCEGSLVEHALFIPMISVKIPYTRLLGYNATVKIDDKDFQATNPGVWCHSLHDLMDRENFTSWAAYTKDKVIK